MSASPSRARRVSWGVTLPELLVVVSIVGLAVAISIPLATQAVRSSRIRVAADQYALTLKAARMIAVSKQAPVDVVISADPDNYFEYTDGHGVVRRYVVPPGVRILPPGTTITFAANGSVNGPASTTFQAALDARSVETWTIDTNILGVQRISRVVE